MKHLLFTVIVLGVSQPSLAQNTRDPAPVALQASRSATVVVREPSISAQAANRVVSAALEEASRRNMRVSVSVLDRSGAPVAFMRMDGAALGSIETAVGKARTAAAWNLPSADFETMLRSGVVGPLSLDGLVLIEGGVPLVYEGVPVGSVGISGGSSKDDGAVARAAAATLNAAARR
jgi:glc operon protein GlcG